MSDSRRGFSKEFWQKLGLLLVSTLVGLLLVEAYFRIFAPCRLYGFEFCPPQVQLFEYDETIGWRGRPNAAGTFASTDFYTQVHLDASGFRNDTPPNVPGRHNILMVGDSFAWGWGMEDNHTVSSMMNGQDKRFNIYNIALPGFGPDQEYLTLRDFLSHHESLRFEGAVLLLCTDNDFDDAVATERYNYPKPRYALVDGHLELQNVPVPRKPDAAFDTPRPLRQGNVLKPGLLNYSHAYNAVFAYLRYYQKNRLKEEAARQKTLGTQPPEARAQDEQDHRLVMALIDAMRDEAAGANMWFDVVVLHSGPSTPRLEETLRFLDQAGIRHITYNCFGSRWRPRTMCTDPHLNVYGNRLLAEETLEMIRARYLAE